MTTSLDQIEQEAMQHARQWPIWLVHRARQYEHVVSAAQTNLPEDSSADAQEVTLPSTNSKQPKKADDFFLPLEEQDSDEGSVQPGLAITSLLAQTEDDAAEGYDKQPAIEQQLVTVPPSSDAGDPTVRGRAIAEAHQRQQRED